jgi:hypothetical protein
MRQRTARPSITDVAKRLDTPLWYVSFFVGRDGDTRDNLFDYHLLGGAPQTFLLLEDQPMGKDRHGEVFDVIWQHEISAP